MFSVSFLYFLNETFWNSSFKKINIIVNYLKSKTNRFLFGGKAGKFNLGLTIFVVGQWTEKINLSQNSIQKLFRGTDASSYVLPSAWHTGVLILINISRQYYTKIKINNL